MDYKICESALCEGAISRSKPHIGVVLLAAGASRRMGMNKQLIPWKDKTVLDAVCTALVTGLNRSDIFPSIEKRPLVAVTSGKESKVDAIAESYGFTIAINEHAELGQGSSIATGVKSVIASQHLMPLDGIICSVGDQPLLEPFVISQLIDTFTKEMETSDGKAIIVPHYGADYRSGNPVLFGSYWFDALQRIEGDQGGKTIIRGEGSPYVKAVWISRDIGDDIDTPEDVERLKQRESEVL